MTLQYDAAVLHQARTPLTIERVSGAALGSSDVRVRVRAAGLCHTDLEVIEGSLRYPMPMVLGHEAAGVVEQVGPAAPGGGVIPRQTPPRAGRWPPASATDVFGIVRRILHRVRPAGYFGSKGDSV